MSQLRSSSSTNEEESISQNRVAENVFRSLSSAWWPTKRLGNAIPRQIRQWKCKANFANLQVILKGPNVASRVVMKREEVGFQNAFPLALGHTQGHRGTIRLPCFHPASPTPGSSKLRARIIYLITCIFSYVYSEMKARTHITEPVLRWSRAVSSSYDAPAFLAPDSNSKIEYSNIWINSNIESIGTNDEHLSLLCCLTAAGALKEAKLDSKKRGHLTVHSLELTANKIRNL